MSKRPSKSKMTTVKNDRPATQPGPAMVFRNIAALLQAGIFPGTLAATLAEGIKFCNEVAEAEEKKLRDGDKTEGAVKEEAN